MMTMMTMKNMNNGRSAPLGVPNSLDEVRAQKALLQKRMGKCERRIKRIWSETCVWPHSEEGGLAGLVESGSMYLDALAAVSHLWQKAKSLFGGER